MYYGEGPIKTYSSILKQVVLCTNAKKIYKKMHPLKTTDYDLE